MRRMEGDTGGDRRRSQIFCDLIRGLAAALCTAGLLTASAAAQQIPGLPGNQGAAADLEPTSPERIAARRVALAAELAAVERALAPVQDDSRRAHLQEVLERLNRIDGLLRQQLELASSDYRSEPLGSDGPRDRPPSLLSLNGLYEARIEAEQRRTRLVEALAESREALAAAKQNFDEAEKERREASSEVSKTPDEIAESSARRTLELRQLASRTAEERVNLAKLETRLAQEKLEHAADPDFDEHIAQMRQAIARGEGVSQPSFAAVTQREGELRRGRDALERRLATAELRLDAAQRRFSREGDSVDLLEEVEALRAGRDAIRQEIDLIDAQLERLGTQRAIWQQWNAVLRGEGTNEQLASWKDGVGERIDALEQAELRRQGHRADLERRLAAVEERLASLPADARVRSVLEEQRAALSSLLEAERIAASSLARDRRLSERLLADLRERTGEINPLEYVAWALQALRNVWAYEITTVDDAPITVGSLVLALLVAAVGLWASRRGSTWVGKLATEQLKLDAGAAHALQTIFFYVLLVSFTLLALRTVHFPLTAFTILGGALAIGIGFGSQNVMNNFISGLILMLERPVRPSDVVEVDNNHGTIERIGARSTQIRSVDGRHIIVPNSFFLENNVVNWTLSDDLIRTRVVVGVIYGSPTRLVEELIRRVVEEDDQVLKSPEPIILFDEFGDNSLNFEVCFWVNARSPMGMRRVQSRVRFRIDDLFREHGLVIAFPQRDVHLDSAAPIDVRLVNGDDQAEPKRPK